MLTNDMIKFMIFNMRLIHLILTLLKLNCAMVKHKIVNYLF